ncbi:MAG: class I SAM-dependent methyltransferase [Candidatus Heimdallarchaeota archaeon]
MALKEDKKSQYDLTAHLYSFFTGFLYLFGGMSEERFRRKIIQENLPIQGNEKVLDICCANGKGTNILASYLKDGFVYGLDLNPSMIQFAERRTQKTSNIEFKVGDCSNLPFASNSIDIVTSFLALHELPTELLPKVFSEIRRVLTDDGLFLVFDLAVPSKSSGNINFVYYAFRLFEDETAARFMMIDQGAYYQKYGFKILKHQKYINGFINVYLLKIK